MKVYKMSEKNDTKMTTKQLKRVEIPVEQTWDMASVFPDLDAWEQAFSELSTRLGEVVAYRGRLSESADTLYQAIKNREDIIDGLMRVGIYAMHRSDEDTA